VPTTVRLAHAAVLFAAVAAAVFLAAPSARADSGGNVPQGQGPSGQAATSQDASAGASADQSGAQNSNATVRTDQAGNEGAVRQQNTDASAAAAGSTTSTTGGTGDQSSNASADANATQISPGNDNANIRVGSPGDTTGTSQSNDVQAGATAAASDPCQGGQDGTSCAHGANANANANASQKDAKNKNVDVLVGSPGNVGPSDQSNTVTSGATSSDNSTAQAAQTSPTNVNVVVRIGSPGDNGSVDQQNAATATGTGAPAPPPKAGDTNATADVNQTLSTTGQVDGTNVATTGQSVDQRQGGDPPTVSESPATPTGGADPTPNATSASATQTGAANVNVSVRIDSPGTDAPVRQSNTASATDIVNTDGGANANVSIVIPGTTSAPSGDTWTWNWIWDGSWTPEPGSTAQDVAPTDDPAWNWNWSPDAATPAPPNDPSGDGSFKWTWTWTLPNGQTITSTNQWACNCNWDWNWTWDWSKGAPEGSTQAAASDTQTPAQAAPAQTYDTSDVTQQNSTAATAQAVTEAEVSQTVDQSPGSDGADPTETVVSDQTAEADASATAIDPENDNFDWGVATDPVSQVNQLDASAFALDHLDATQVAIQQQQGAAGTSQAMSSTQQVVSFQSAIAVALAGSTKTVNSNRVWAPDPSSGRVGGVLQRNSASADATSVDWAGALQWSQQFQVAGQATTQSEQAFNVLWSSQDARATAIAWQSNAANVNDVLVPAGSHATSPSLAQQNLDTASSTAINYSQTEQWISQTQNGESDDESSYAYNLAYTDQSDDESVTAAQIDVVNRSGWLGIEPVGDGAAPLTIVVEVPWSRSVVEAVSIALPPPDDAFRPLLRPRSHLLTALARGVSAAPLRRHANAPASIAAVRGTLGHSVHAQRSRIHTRSGADRTSSSAPSGVALAAGAAGPAPGTGGGMPALTGGRITLVAPAHLGPRSTASALGPPMRIADPIERPG
jgi:hypothetical protein